MEYESIIFDHVFMVAFAVIYAVLLDVLFEEPFEGFILPSVLLGLVVSSLNPKS